MCLPMVAYYTVQDRYDAFMRVAHEWRHLKMLKRAGHGHDLTWIVGTTQGGCAVLYPACPHPGKNLPLDLDKAPESEA